MTIPSIITCKILYVMDWCTRVEVGEKIRVKNYNAIAAQLYLGKGTPTWVPISDVRKFFEGWTE